MTDETERIFSLLKEKGLDQKEFAALLGTTDKTVSAWKTGRSKSYTKKLQQIASILGTSVDYLTSGNKNTPADQQANGRDEEFAQLFGQLTPDQQDLVLAQLRGIVDRKDK